MARARLPLSCSGEVEFVVDLLIVVGSFWLMNSVRCVTWRSCHHAHLVGALRGAYAAAVCFVFLLSERQLAYAKSMPQTDEVRRDVETMRHKLGGLAALTAVLVGVHAVVKWTAPLISGTLIALTMPVSWCDTTGFADKYGCGLRRSYVGREATLCDEQGLEPIRHLRGRAIPVGYYSTAPVDEVLLQG